MKKVIRGNSETVHEWRYVNWNTGGCYLFERWRSTALKKTPKTTTLEEKYYDMFLYEAEHSMSVSMD